MFIRVCLFLLLISFCYACARSDRIQYESAQSIDSVEGYQQFLRKNPDSRFADDVQKQLYKAAYVKTVETNTAEAFDEYIRKYPESPYLENLIKKKEAVLIAEVFKEVQEADTLRAYVDFVTKYPESDLAKESTKNILSKQLELGVKPSENVGSATESSLGDITKLTPEEISKLPPEQISAFIKSLQQQPPKTASRRLPVAQTPSAQIGELTAQAPLLLPPQAGFIEEPAASSPNRQKSPSIKADLQENPQFEVKAGILEKEPQNQVRAEILDKKPQIKAEAKISDTNGKISSIVPDADVKTPDAENQTLPEQYSDLVDNTAISFRSPSTPDKILYGRAFIPAQAPRVIHKEFSFFIKALRRTSQYVEIKASFHNLKQVEKEFIFSRINLVNSHGKRVKPIRVEGGGWKALNNGVVQSKAFGNERSEFVILFPSLNLFRNDNYKLYVTLNNKNYLIQI